jgi:hypothetical protein
MAPRQSALCEGSSLVDMRARAWAAFGEANGARSAQEMRARIARYRKTGPSDRSDFEIGCRILTQPFFFEEPDNLVRLTGHWIARGWSDAEIVTAAESLTLPGYTVAQTRREVAQMIRGGRTKWARPNPNNTIEEEEPKPPHTAASVREKSRNAVLKSQRQHSTSSAAGQAGLKPRPILQPGGRAARFLSAMPASCGFLPGLLLPAGALPAGAAPVTRR